MKSRNIISSPWHKRKTRESVQDRCREEKEAEKYATGSAGPFVDLEAMSADWEEKKKEHDGIMDHRAADEDDDAWGPCWPSNLEQGTEGVRAPGDSECHKLKALEGGCSENPEALEILFVAAKAKWATEWHPLWDARMDLARQSGQDNWQTTTIRMMEEAKRNEEIAHMLVRAEEEEESSSSSDEGRAAADVGGR